MVAPSWDLIKWAAMYLDMMTMSVVNLTVTTVLAGMLLLTWGRDAWSQKVGPRFVGSWGLAMLIHGLGVAVMLGAALTGKPNVVTLGASITVLAVALKWGAAREYAELPRASIWIVLGPVGYFFLIHAGLVETVDARLIAWCIFLAAYSIAAALELRRIGDASLCWPAVSLLILTGISYLSWIPFSIAAPIEHVDDAFSSAWLPAVVLVTMLMRVALAFIVLSMAKEREEQEQRRDALTDSLTGMPNRRALFEAADVVGERRILGGTPVSVLIFDLDHFKDTNDSYGHNLGDEVLKIFAATAQRSLKVNAIIGRLGGEEFAGILPGVDAETAVEAAERVRCAFSRAAAFVNGLAVGATVSVGVASDTDVDADLSGLFRRADAALYVAKRAGRNRVELLEPDGDSAPPRSAVRTSPRRTRKNRSYPEPVRTT